MTPQGRCPARASIVASSRSARRIAPRAGRRVRSSASRCSAAAEDWAAVVGGGADAQLRRRSRRTCARIPGTDTRFLVGGFVQLDGLFTRNKQTGAEQDTFLVSATPFGPADSDRRASIRQSQVNWLSETPTELGTITTAAQVNLFSLDFDGKTKLSLRRLYAQLARRVHRRQDVFHVRRRRRAADDARLQRAERHDGSPAVARARDRPVGRRVDARGRHRGFAGGSSRRPPRDRLRTEARRPDLAAHLRFDFERGHVQLSGLSRRIDLTATTGSATTERTFDASGLSISGSLATFGDDSLVAQYTTGKGIGRYFNDSVSATGIGARRRRSARPHPQLRRHALLPAFLDAGLDDASPAPARCGRAMRARARPTRFAA